MTKILDRLAKERRRLVDGPRPEDMPEGIGTVRFLAQCPGNADTVLNKAREVLLVVNTASMGNWPSDEEWSFILPSWFVSRCPPKPTSEHVLATLRELENLPALEQSERIRNQEWSIHGWIQYFKPDGRVWYWWDGCQLRANFMAVAIEVDSWPFSWVALSWLLRAAGAIKVGEEDDLSSDLKLDELGIDLDE